MEDIDMEILRAYRVRFQNENASHVWNTYDDKHFLEMLGGYRKDRGKGIEGLTLAGLMMFGNGLAVREDDTLLHKAVREACVNMAIHADYLTEGTLRVLKTAEGFEITNPGVLKIPKEEIFRGGNSKARNPKMQNMLRMVGFGDNIGSGFPTILSAWEEQGWETPELNEDTILNQVTLVLKMTKNNSTEILTQKPTKKNRRKKRINIWKRY